MKNCDAAIERQKPMSEQEREQSPAKQEEPVREQAEYTPSVQPDFMREKIKQKPVNKRKLLRRTVITVVMAVVFGMVACVTFLILEPVISNRLYPEEEPQEVVFPEETLMEEMNPEDMLVNDEVEEDPQPVEVELEDEQIEELLSQVEFSLEDYQSVYNELKKLAEKANRAVVTVAGVTSDVDWFNNIYENVASASGVIVADNGKAMLVLVSAGTLNGADTIEVTFCDQTQAEAEILQKDPATGLAILSVPLASISEETMDVITKAELGSSSTNSLLGTPVIALGSPLGTSGSVCYGVVTSTGTAIDMPDASYKKLTTDIYGSRNATGVIINLKGMVIGIIDNVNTSNDMTNLLTAYGITELKRTIEQMSNDKERAYLGIYGADVPKEALEDPEVDIPTGTYVREIEIDSPAMAAGIQSGDVVIRVGETPVNSYYDLLNIIRGAEPEEMLTFTLVRQGHEMKVDVTFGHLPEGN